MSDLISREAALLTLKIFDYDIIPSVLARQYVREMLDTLYVKLNDIPSAESERKWIPVSERLPKPWQEVLTTYEYKGKRFVQTAEYAGSNDENGHPLFCAYSDEFAPDHYNFIYVAWMPLVEPWRGE